MRKSRFSEEQIVGMQIVGILKEQAAGEATGTLCRRHGISQQTLYRWKQKYDGLEGKELKRLKALEEENARLKRLVAEQALDNQALKELLRKNW
jgi:putative transposase